MKILKAGEFLPFQLQSALSLVITNSGIVKVNSKLKHWNIERNWSQCRNIVWPNTWRVLKAFCCKQITIRMGTSLGTTSAQIKRLSAGHCKQRHQFRWADVWYDRFDLLLHKRLLSKSYKEMKLRWWRWKSHPHKGGLKYSWGVHTIWRMSWCWRSGLVSMNWPWGDARRGARRKRGEIPAEWRLVVLNDVIAIRFSIRFSIRSSAKQWRWVAAID